MDTPENSVCARILRQCVRINVVTVMTIHRGRHSSRSHDNGSYRVRFSFPARQLRIRSPLSRLRAYVLFALIGARNNEPAMRRGQKRSRRRRWELETADAGAICTDMHHAGNGAYRWFELPQTRRLHAMNRDAQSCGRTTEKEIVMFEDKYSCRR